MVFLTQFILRSKDVLLIIDNDRKDISVSHLVFYHGQRAELNVLIKKTNWIIIDNHLSLFYTIHH